MLDTVLCSCGSGLRQIRCCAMDQAALPDPANLTALDEAGAEATKLFNEKKTAAAETLALKLLDLAPNHRLPLRVLFEIRRAENKPKAAEMLARRLADLPAANAQMETAANLQLAQLLIGRGRFADAEPSARKALIASPRDVTVQHVMGVVLTETGHAKAGERHYRKALALLGRDDGMVLANTAWNLKLQGRLNEAADLYKRALALRPDNTRAIGGFAQVEMGRGNHAEAIALLDDGLRRWPEDRTLRLLRILTDLTLGNAQAVLDRLTETPENLLPAELSARGQALALLNRPAEAIGAYALGKKMQRERYGQSYAPAEFIKKAERFKAYFTADRLLSIPRATTSPSPNPVFLLGFPRSGTALLEQMLAQIPGFAAGDDFSPLPGLADQIAATETYPEALNNLLIGNGLDLPDTLRARYQTSLAESGFATPNLRYITDRNPALYWHLGLVKLLFPDAPIIHVIRHPLDVILSNLAQEKKLEANCGVSMSALSRHYDLVMSMIRHYRGQLTLRYLPIRYEDLVTSPTTTIAQILAFIGPDAGTVPDEYDLRANKTFSEPAPAHFTVREPLHSRGLYRHHIYQAVMPELFSEIRPVLTPWINTLGYGDPT